MAFSSRSAEWEKYLNPRLVRECELTRRAKEKSPESKKICILYDFVLLVFVTPERMTLIPVEWSFSFCAVFGGPPWLAFDLACHWSTRYPRARA